MNMSDYGMLHLIHKLRAAEIERQQQGWVYDFGESAEPSVSLIRRFRNWLRGQGAPVHLTRYEPVHLNS